METQLSTLNGHFMKVERTHIHHLDRCTRCEHYTFFTAIVGLKLLFLKSVNVIHKRLEGNRIA